MPSRVARHPVFSALTLEDCWALLQRNHVGRIAFLGHGMVDIEPVHYVANDAWVFVRSADGAKLEAFSHHPYIAFEVDEVDDLFDWRSVVAHGTVYLMSEPRGATERATFARAVRALRSLIPTALGDDDPTPARTTVYGIHVDRITGRQAKPGPAASKRAARPTPAPRPQRMHRRPRTPDGF
jgi:nitroimidazol reductase NimA-like FMN-containing flavoprotein (pyridoxamine 5'-phosphate oxidase superfamily)